MRHLYRFGAFRLDAAERRLWRADELIALTPKQFDLLFYFVENAGRVTKKSELLDAVWANTYVEETTLARNVSWLRKLLEDGAGGERLIETVPKIGYRFDAQVTRFDPDETALIVEEQFVGIFRGEETISIDDALSIKEENQTNNRESAKINSSWQNVTPFRGSFFVLTFLLIGIAFVALAGSGYNFYENHFKSEAQIAGSNIIEKASLKNVPVGDVPADGEYRNGIRPAVSKKTQIKIGSIVNLRNQSSDEAGYLDAWGAVKNKPEFSIVPTETMFVSTHPNPNRDNGSGSWEIVSAAQKRDGETLVFGDKIHLRSMYPDGGYLDNCGWIKDMPVFKKFVKIQKFAVFTAYSEDRDNGTGTWIISSDDKFDGDSVLEGDGIALENNFPGGGFLDAAGVVNDIAAFSDYDGSRLVFIHESSTSRRPRSGIWTISDSRMIIK